MTADEEAKAAELRDEIAGGYVYQLLGAIVGDVRILADGTFIAFGACTLADASKINDTYKEASALLIDYAKIVPVELLDSE